MAYTEEALRSLVDDYDEGKRQLLARRDQRIRDFHASGWRPVDLQRITGYSRETIRQALNPKVRQAANVSRRKVQVSSRADYATYSDRKPYVVAERLDDLRGPTGGTVTLPSHLDWSGRA